MVITGIPFRLKSLDGLVVLGSVMARLTMGGSTTAGRSAVSVMLIPITGAMGESAGRIGLCDDSIAIVLSLRTTSFCSSERLMMLAPLTR